MQGESLRCEVRTGAVAEVLLQGDLRRESTLQVRAAVLKCFTEEPEAVLLDLSGITAFDDQALPIFLLLARAAAAWPGIRLIAHSAPPALAARMRARAVTRLVALVADAAAAREQAAAGGGPVLIRLSLLSGLDDLPLAREAVRSTCLRVGWTGIADAAELVTAELVANALNHAVGPRTISIATTTRHLHVAVRDGSTEPPVVRPAQDGPGGRGMRIVQALSTTWDYTPTTDGKVVWATMRAHGQRFTAAPSSPFNA